MDRPSRGSIDHQPSLLFCQCVHGEFISDEQRKEWIAMARDSGRNVVLVDDLCGMAAEKSPLLRQWAGEEALTIIACYPRAVREMFSAAGVSLEENEHTFLNPRNGDGKEIERALTQSVTENRSDVLRFEETGDWIPWFPVIDYERCSGCRQCANFCLFGVYEIDDQGKVEVAHPEKCKTNCPACARICPEVAIMFPKLAESPLNGDTITAENTLGSRVRLDPEQAVGEDVYAQLAERRRRMKRILLRKQAREQACLERSACCETAADRESPGDGFTCAAEDRERVTESTGVSGKGSGQ